MSVCLCVRVCVCVPSEIIEIFRSIPTCTVSPKQKSLNILPICHDLSVRFRSIPIPCKGGDISFDFQRMYEIFHICLFYAQYSK